MGSAKRAKIALLTLYTPEIAAIGDISVCNKRTFCALRGYDLLVERAVLDSTRPPVWSKVLAILKHLPRYEWLFWSDPDSLVMAFGARLEGLCDNQHDLLITNDCNGLNAGQMLIRNTSRSMAFFQQVYEQRQFVGTLFQEQAAMADLLKSQPPPLRVKYCPQRSFNSYPSNYECGDFILHFAGTYNKLAGMLRYQGLGNICVPDRSELGRLFAKLGLLGSGLIAGEDGHVLTPMFQRNWPGSRLHLVPRPDKAAFSDSYFDWVYLDIAASDLPLECLCDWFRVLKPGGILAGRGCSERGCASLHALAEKNDLTLYLAGDPPCDSWHVVKGSPAAERLGAALVRQAGSGATCGPDELRRAREHYRNNRLREADEICRQIVIREPENAEALHQLGWVTHQQGYYQEAVDLMNRSLKLKPATAEWHNDLGAILFSHGYLDDAARHFRETARLRPDHPTALTNLAVLLEKKGCLDQAIAAYREAFSHRPPTAKLLNDLSTLLARCYRFEEAIAVCREALKLDSRSAECWSNLAVVLQEAGRLDEALWAFDQAVELRPNGPEVRSNRGMALLLTGDYLRGWPEYAFRWKQMDRDSRIARTGRPHWTGESLHDKTILLYEHDGFGDALQFARYASLVASLGARVILRCPPRLGPLLKRLEGVWDVVGSDQPLPEFDCYAPLIELPIHFKTTVSSVPANIPYLSPDPDLVARWHERLAHLGGARVGIAWQADPRHTSSVRRSVPLSAFGKLAGIAAVHLISLQKGPGSEQISAVDFPVLDLGPDVDATSGAFMDTAAVMKCLDLVITVDTSIAHLAGAIGVPTWVLLPAAAEWRWMRDRSDSPWYPTARLFRQKRWGIWDEVFDQVYAELLRKSS